MVLKRFHITDTGRLVCRDGGGHLFISVGYIFFYPCSRDCSQSILYIRIIVFIIIILSFFHIIYRPLASKIILLHSSRSLATFLQLRIPICCRYFLTSRIHRLLGHPCLLVLSILATIIRLCILFIIIFIGV